VDEHSGVGVQPGRRELSGLLQLLLAGRPSPRTPEPRGAAQLLEQRRRRLPQPPRNRLLPLGPRADQRVRRGLRTAAGQAAEDGPVGTLHKRQQKHGRGFRRPRASHHKCQNGGF
ncbi:hypothetical protein M9458_022524, partial [Cirrhinus mrigala]